MFEWQTTHQDIQEEPLVSKQALPTLHTKPGESPTEGKKKKDSWLYMSTALLKVVYTTLSGTS